MPWDAPAPAAASEPPVDDVVPYTDADATPYEDTPEPAMSAAPAMPVAQASSPSGAPAAFPAATRAAGDERGAGGEDPAASLTPEFADIASMLTAAFGTPLSVSVESAATTSDEDAAAELAYDEGLDADSGFTDEPVDDGDDD